MQTAASPLTYGANEEPAADLPDSGIWFGVPGEDLRWNLRGPERHNDGKGVNRTHFNLQVQSSRGDRWHNYHIYFGEVRDDVEVWEVNDGTDVDGVDPDALRKGDDILGSKRFFEGDRVPFAPIADAAYDAAYDASWKIAGAIGEDNNSPLLVRSVGGTLMLRVALVTLYECGDGTDGWRPGLRFPCP